MATHSRILLWRVPWTEEPSGPWSTGSQRDTTEATQHTVNAPTHTHIHTHTLILSVCGLHENYMQRKSLDSKMSVSQSIYIKSTKDLYLFFFFFFSSTSLLLPTHLPPPSCTHAQSGNPMDFSLPDSSVHGFFQARILEWIAISFSKKTCILKI